VLGDASEASEYSVVLNPTLTRLRGPGVIGRVVDIPYKVTPLLYGLTRAFSLGELRVRPAMILRARASKLG
jgi:hypothetical protein